MGCPIYLWIHPIHLWDGAYTYGMPHTLMGWYIHIWDGPYAYKEKFPI